MFFCELHCIYTRRDHAIKSRRGRVSPYFVSEGHHRNPQTERLADFGDRVDGHIHASVFDAAKVTGIKTAAVGEVANRQACGIASVSDGRCPFRAVRLPRIGFSLDDLAGGIGQRHRRAFALLNFGIGKGVSAEAAFITAIVVVPLLVRTEHELLRVDGE